MTTTQQDCSIGFKEQVDFATQIVVDRFLEFTDETFDFERSYYQGAGMRPGSRAPRSPRKSLVSDGAAGDIGLEVPSKGLGALLRLLFGVSTSTLVTTGVYQQLFTLTKTDFLPVATMQVGIPRLGANTVDTFTMVSAFATQFGLALGNADVLKLTSSWRAKQLLLDTAYATPSYPSSVDLLSFVGASLKIGGSVTPPTTTALASGGTPVGDVTDFSINIDQGLDDGGRYIGGAGKLGRPGAVGQAAITGSLTADYDAVVFRDAIAAGTGLALVARFEGPVEIASGYKATLEVTCPDIRFEGELPKSNGGGVIQQTLPFTAYDNLVAAEPIYVATRTTDSAL
jgi:hypothetical protein